MTNITIKTLSPKAHIEICTLIKKLGAEILDSDIGCSDFYGKFTIETPTNTIDYFMLIKDSLIEIN